MSTICFWNNLLHCVKTLGAFSVGVNACTGMSCLFRKDLIENAGGLAPLGQYLSEDYILSRTISQA
jgi:ceramide glucosyltransferase